MNGYLLSHRVESSASFIGMRFVAKVGLDLIEESASRMKQYQNGSIT